MKRRVLFRCFYQSGTFGYVQYGQPPHEVKYPAK